MSKKLEIQIKSLSTPEKSLHQLQVKGKKIDLTRDQLVALRDEIDFYLETPPELTARRGASEKPASRREQ